MNSRQFVALACLLLAPLAEAAVIKTDFSVNVTQRYDIEADGWETITPVLGTGAFSLDTSNFVVTANGRNISTDFAPTGYVSPLPFYPPNSGNSDLGLFTSAHAWGYTSDDPTGFVESVIFSVYFNSAPNGGPSSTTDFGVTIFRKQAPRHGDGTSAYAFTEDRLVSFLQSVMQDGDPVSYYEGYSSVRYNDEGYNPVRYGQAWKDESARIVGINVDGVSLAVPEPSSWALMLLGILGVTSLARLGRSRDAPRTSQAH